VFKISLSDGKTFECEGSESILAGAARNGIFLEHSCLTGRCTSCKARVILGKTNCEIEELSLSKSEIAQGYILSCVRKPTTDIILEAEDLSVYGLVKPKTVPAKISEILSLTADTILVRFRFPPNQKPIFLEGQYVNIIKDNIKRSYSIANTSKSDYLELIIKEYPGGIMSKYWFGEAKLNDLIRMEIPKGTFFLRNHSHKNTLIFLATGTGIAPIKSIFENLQNQERIQKYQRVLLLWGVRFESEVFWTPIGNVEFYPVYSREQLSRKYVQDVILELDVNFKNAVIYACGSDKMIRQAKINTVQKGLPEYNFYSDAFVQSY
jgi:CDP-4-dehydro-6-deoxyglucose reductase, E3